MSRWYENIAYGPLTREDFDKLSLAQYDDTDRAVHRVAERRLVRRGDHLRIKLGEMIARGELQPEPTGAPAETLEGKNV